MNSKILDGRKLAKSREAKLKKKLSSLKFTPKVVSILIGSDPPSVLYTSMKQKKALEVGIEFEPIEFSVDTPVSEIVKKIYELNKDPKIAGIMIQLPMPKEFLIGLDPKEIIELIDPKKDIDGLTSKRLVPPAAAKASMQILLDEGVEVKGKNAVVLGASELVGKPMGRLLEEYGAKVIVCNSKTEDLVEKTRKADIIVSAVGKPGILTGDMVSKGVVVVDIGAEKVGDKVVGDADFESVSKKASRITPVPGGVGPMTIIALMENVLELVEKYK
ncbi:MAG: bifunctional 5,10-methylene-tetrahydrofolate dehydrogenase/5,10-methylene-tetrahydrofolate cyclohydrolase [uncultured bacterium]|uniref:Bifunctional protein FolD n=3 Tax=Candidatus Daviesiibacteriota TaxID=1752718 RepID=A0A0G0HWU4_9BACT|nr:MAG: bifunctional 5,10-methylene-tetrahydrofolate dehydrogenase/5,10-methylene-tetrahydrofolate cyclohydrolase [uncultured bacterium]KKQ08366.1 MAG: Bifunctional protein FolD [Candidatus Daviesbacteria bacterium GW2011_GWB1_36_5]KKQ16179.1 MAG: Bifunctional protein FolD [Candidatus Daviesbacteria bacterium GW2011_GWA1_36_8]OGE33253.1 MAG: hypothetical protein A3C99_01405 [Candidatus Daviesbacteria bacterium RIFCSPHIGHO2_02_FULL_37_9]OGE36155.1 MAG: hypothetical protein A3E66_05095 [Candidatu